MSLLSVLSSWNSEMLARERGLALSLDRAIADPSVTASLTAVQNIRELLTALESKLSVGPDGVFYPREAAQILWSAHLPPQSGEIWLRHQEAIGVLRQRWTDLFLNHSRIITEKIDAFIAEHQTGVLSILEDAAKIAGENTEQFLRNAGENIKEMLPSFGTVGFVLLGIVLLGGIALTAGVVLRG